MAPISFSLRQIRESKGGGDPRCKARDASPKQAHTGREDLQDGTGWSDCVSLLKVLSASSSADPHLLENPQGISPHNLHNVFV
jgi:hypothetical protein